MAEIESLAPLAEADLPPSLVDIDDGAFETITDLGEAAELIVVGTVTDEVSLGRPLPSIRSLT